jgi:hypothetical protein
MIDCSQKIDVSSHDRYLIYEMLDREVSFEHARDNRKQSGIVERVLRDIFDNEVEVTINGRPHRFQEPAAIVRTSDDTTPFGAVIFVYGDFDPDLSDEQLFEQMRSSSEYYGETVDDVLARTRKESQHIVKFVLGKKAHRRRTWRMKVD